LLSKNYAEAESQARLGLQKQPNSGFGQFVLGASLARSHKLSEAEQALRRALELDPSIHKAHLELVSIFLAQDRAKDAISELQLFLKAAPNDPLAGKAQEVLARLQNSHK
jgi:cytochrome c-type biogenesis protein CcmH/NrfG